MSIEYLRSFRVYGYAIFDIAISFIGVYLLGPLLSSLLQKVRIRVPVKNWLFLTLPLGLIFHLIFQQNTRMTVNLLDPHAHYLLKVFFLILLILGLRGVRLGRSVL